MTQKWTFKGGCNSPDEDCCYWNGEHERELYDTEAEAEKAAVDRFPTGRGFPWWHEVFEIK
jgi:hypothetical protein